MGKVIDFQTAKKRIIKNKKNSNKFKLSKLSFTPAKFYLLLFLVILSFSYFYIAIKF